MGKQNIVFEERLDKMKGFKAENLVDQEAVTKFVRLNVRFYVNPHRLYKLFSC